MFLVIVDGLALLLLFLNVVLLAAVHARRIRQYFRTRRAKRFRARVEEVFDEFDPATRARAPRWLRAQIGEFDELERPIAATMLVERMKAASEEERAQTRDVLRDAGVLDSLTRSLLGRRFPPMETFVRVSLGTPAEMKEFWRVWDLLPLRIA